MATAAILFVRRCAFGWSPDQQPELTAPGDPLSVELPATDVARHQFPERSLSVDVTLVSFSSMLKPLASGQPATSL